MKRIIILAMAFVVFEAAGQTSLSLQECRQMALQNDIRVKNARLDILAASVQKQEALTEYFPKVSLNSFGFMALDPLLEVSVKDILGESGFSAQVQQAVDYLGEQFGFPSVYTALRSGFSASVSALQPIYTGGRIINGNRLAELGRRASLLQDDMTERDVLENTDRDYWKIVFLESKIATLDASETFLNNLYEDLAAAVDAGLALDTDLMQVELKLNELKKMRLSLTGGIRLAKMSLFNTIGQPYSLISTLSDNLKPYIDNLILSDGMDNLDPPSAYYKPAEEIVAGLSETGLLDMAVEEKRLERKMALGEALPQVGIGASYGYTHALNSRFNGLVFAMVKIPISDWGKISRKMKRIDYDMQKAQNNREYLSSQLLLRVHKLWLDLTVAWEEVALAREDVLLAQKNADRMQDQYKAGLVTLSDLLQSRMLLRTRTDACIEAQTDYLSALSSYVLLK